MLNLHPVDHAPAWASTSLLEPAMGALEEDWKPGCRRLSMAIHSARTLVWASQICCIWPLKEMSTSSLPPLRPEC